MIGIGKVVHYWLHIGVEDRTRILRPHQHSVGYLKLNFFQDQYNMFVSIFTKMLLALAPKRIKLVISPATSAAVP